MILEYWYYNTLIETVWVTSDFTLSNEPVITTDSIDLRLYTNEMQLIGEAGYLLYKDDGEELFCFNGLEVAEGFRGRGIGTFLVHVRQRIAAVSFPALEQCVHCNTHSIGIYKRLGFEVRDHYTILTRKNK